MVYVCPQKDHECGDFEANWCADCPKRKVGKSASEISSAQLLVQLIETLKIELLLTKESKAKIEAAAYLDRQERDRLKTDARRYRWIRSAESAAMGGAWEQIMEADCVEEKMDAVVDRFMPPTAAPLEGKPACDCAHSDKWRCADSKRLTTLTCRCSCHQNGDKQS